MAQGQHDDQTVRQLVTEIDESGTNLSRGEINFIADIIDGKQMTFLPEEAKRIESIYQRRVVNGRPERD